MIYPQDLSTGSKNKKGDSLVTLNMSVAFTNSPHFINLLNTSSSSPTTYLIFLSSAIFMNISFSIPSEIPSITSSIHDID